ncbi:MAG: flagellar basal-body rod protein FlgF [Bacillota bacterium]|nr:flagellar basal-body rod protein FlgF [Bacillota bacterium]MDW7682992.1 flagellar basal-body rod protein FlgF [Bacillota bacterium]
MIRGLYTAASGMMVEAARQETITNNVANSDTAGFKKDLAMQRAYPEQAVARIGDGGVFPRRPLIGVLGLGSLVDSIHTSYEQGNLTETGRAMDLAVAGDGFFTVDTPQGVRYTRSGSFSVDADRTLVNDQGDRVLGVDGPLQLPEGELTVDGSGRVFVNEVYQGQLNLRVFAEPAELRKVGNSLFAANEEAVDAPFTGAVRQGFLETSNVEMVQEMVRMLSALRAYETNQRVVQAQDELLGKAVNEIGALR